MKQFKTAGILLAILLILGGIATWDEWQTKRDEQEKAARNKLTLLKPEEITELEYRRVEQAPSTNGAEDSATVDGSVDDSKSQESVSLKLKKVDDTWRITDPVNTLADQDMVTTLIKTVTDYQYEKEVAQGEGRFADFGLEPAHIAVTIAAGKTDPETIYIGSKAPVGYSVFSRTSGSDRIYIGSQHLLTGTTKTLHEFRDKTLVRIPVDQLAELEYINNSQKLSLVFEKKDGQFSLSPHSKGAGSTDFAIDQNAVRDFLDELNFAKVQEFIDTPDMDFSAAFQSPTYEVVWKLESGESQALKFISKDDKLYATFDGSRIFELQDEFKSKIDKGSSAFRDRRVIKVGADQLARIEVDGENYVQIGESWYTTEQADLFEDGKFKGDETDKPEEQSHIKSLLMDLEFAKADKFLPSNDRTVVSALKSAPQHIVRMILKEGDQVLQIEAYPMRSDDQRYVLKVGEAKEFYTVKRDLFRNTTPSESPGALEGSGEADGGDIPEFELP